MQKDKFTLMLVAFMVFQILLDALLVWSVITQNSATEASLDVLEDFVDYALVLDRKILLTMNAHNAEVESWYIGNKYISRTKAEFSEAMVKDPNRTLEEFNDCIGRYDQSETYFLNVPHMLPDGSVDGYMMVLYGSDFEEIGYWLLTKEYSDYWIYDCGRVHYNATSGDLTYEAPGAFT